MEIIKKKILRKTILVNNDNEPIGFVGVNTDNGGKYVKYGDTNAMIIPNLNVVYNVKILLTSISKNLGFFNASEINDTHYPTDHFLGIGYELLFDDDYI